MAGSLLDVIAARKAEIQAEQVTDVPVPLWSKPALAFRIRPLDHVTLQKHMARVEKAPPSRRAEAMLDANANIVAAATLKVLVGSGEDQAEVELRDMLEPLELSEDGTTAAAIVRAICLRDGDVLVLCEAVMQHSGYSSSAVNEALSGE